MAFSHHKAMSACSHLHNLPLTMAMVSIARTLAPPAADWLLRATNTMGPGPSFAIIQSRGRAEHRDT